MKFPFSKKSVNKNLYLGILWIIIAIIYLLAYDNVKWYFYPTLILGIIYLGIYVYEFQLNYIEISENKIIINSLPRKELNLNEIIDIKYFAGDYILSTPNNSIKIIKSQISKEHISEFEEYINVFQINLNKNVV